MEQRRLASIPRKEQYAELIAHFLTPTLFCFFAEEVGLLPWFNGGLFKRVNYNAKSCFEAFPFPKGLTHLDTAHQRTEA